MPRKQTFVKLDEAESKWAELEDDNRTLKAQLVESENALKAASHMIMELEVTKQAATDVLVKLEERITTLSKERDDAMIQAEQRMSAVESSVATERAATQHLRADLAQERKSRLETETRLDKVITEVATMLRQEPSDLTIAFDRGSDGKIKSPLRVN